MKTRFASVLLALALPLCAQEPAAAEAETMFYKAFYLDKGQRDFAGAMTLYEQFLAKAPEHKLAGEAAKLNFQLLDRTGKTKERDAFKAKYEKLLGNIATAPAAGGAGAGGGGERGAGRGEGGERGAGRGEGGGRPDMQARIAELEKELAKAKEEGNADKVKELEAQLERARAGRGGRGGAGGPGGAGGQGMVGMRLLYGDKKIADMSDEEVGQLKETLAQSSRMIERTREQDPERAKKLEASVADLKKALDAANKEDAQKALDTLRANRPAGRGGRGGGGEGGGNRGGGGGNGNGGGGGGNGGVRGR